MTEPRSATLMVRLQVWGKMNLKRKARGKRSSGQNPGDLDPVPSLLFYWFFSKLVDEKRVYV
jgi:hypothetical protein